MAKGIEQRPEWRLTGIIFFALIAMVLVWAAFKIVQPFLTPILLGAMLVVLTFPTYRRLCARMRDRAYLSATIMLVGATFLIIIPAFFLALLLVQQANGLIGQFQTGHAQEIMARFDASSHLQWVRRFVPSFDPRNVSPQRLILPIIREIPGWVARTGSPIPGRGCPSATR